MNTLVVLVQTAVQVASIPESQQQAILEATNQLDRLNKAQQSI
jgi:hypothetical protein